MKLGVVFPQTEIGHDPAIIKDYVQTAEGLGYAYLLAYDHVLGANPDRPGGWQGPYTYRDSFHEPLVLYGYLAGLTQTIEFVSGILILPQRQTVLVAKQAAQVDLLSGGRFRLGVGIGWNAVEYEALGHNFHTRGKRIEEQVMLLRELWTKPLVTFQGIDHVISDAGLNPLPIQRPIPIWFGGMADAVLRRTARLGDGWFPNRPLNDELRMKLADLRRYLEEEGRRPDDFGIDARLNMGDYAETELAHQVEQWRAVGATHLAVNTMRTNLASPQAHIEAIRKFKALVEG